MKYSFWEGDYIRNKDIISHYRVYSSTVRAKNTHIITHKSAPLRTLILFVVCEEVDVNDPEADVEVVDAIFVTCELMPAVPDIVGDEVDLSDPPPPEAESVPFIAAQYCSSVEAQLLYVVPWQDTQQL